ncbi:hypothetical protein [Neorhodopirellula pilleata]|uniref:Uncharacterized protein n=1 Tax=Neorhodopirellula pilleata TaxID=2714738 RepID=A0A5C6A2S4_9BACT|nr:hypothetical protein [Neorhodopirellula pilleata]TWT93696.1 hypothetical protein Pla100_42140 [Neorhodopirellula pilleata]
MRVSIQLTAAITFAFSFLVTCPGVATVHAAWPLSHTSWPWTPFEGTPRIDPIPPLGTRLPESYRRQYNRPSYIGGKIAAKIAPSSQEAMAFHRAESLGLYDDNGVKGFVNGKHCPPRRVEQHYFYPKPWEVLAVGPRPDRTENEADTILPEPIQLDAPLTLPAPVGELELELPPPPQ